ncbi:hypothetical protein LV476_02610 [Guyparkeria hydrothermalis]|uniref:hypothetical protein n=1 Tax=Guyparkeria hydrothermalis TaxID=923 RepID=UPI002020A7D2|nr:hypothetical protein [Guyparkeria hydrothermalis]MCL7743845.1 hypothetical protein [Guyparkeria hydrothermalis]
MNGSERLRQRAAQRDDRVGRSETVSPAVEVELAKRRLRHSGDRLQARVDLLGLPLEIEARYHPWRTLMVAAASGVAVAELDRATHGSLRRPLLRELMPLLRTLKACGGLTRR